MKPRAGTYLAAGLVYICGCVLCICEKNTIKQRRIRGELTTELCVCVCVRDAARLQVT
jgi:hypothetical protein